MTNTRQMAQLRHQAIEFGALGLSPAESQLYATLVRHPRGSLGELAEQSGLSSPHATAALSRIVASGMAHRIPGHPARYLAVAPEVALGELMSSREQELRAARTAMHQLAEIYRAASRFTHPAELIEVVTGTENIVNRVAQVQAGAREQVRGFDKPPYLQPPGENYEPEERRLTEGIRYRVIYDRDAVAVPGRLAADILPATARGERSRVKARLPMKMFLADDQFAVIPITSSAQVVDAAYVVHPCALLDALSTLFEVEWAAAVPIEQAAALLDDRVDPASEGAPPADAAAVLALLAAGQTDAGIARAMGWSARTTQRRLQHLMAELGATTRFQAGLAASARGWI
jgi:sugar-specific transcriptional regulator TrmB/DNA-binding CsgD family transcriptional regulator